MGKSAEDVRQEIESTRADLGGTLDAIGDRVSPGRMLERRRTRVRQGVQRVRDVVMGTAEDVRDRVSSAAGTGSDKVSSAVGSVTDAPDAMRDRTEGNPLVVGAIAFGAGVLAASLLPVSRTEQEAGAQLADKVQPVKDELTSAGREMVEHLKEPARDAAEQVKEVAREGADEVKSAAKQAGQETKDAAGEARTQVADAGREAAQSA